MNKEIIKEIEKVEKIINYKLPESYKDVWIENNGKISSGYLFKVNGIEKVFGGLYPIISTELIKSTIIDDYYSDHDKHSGMLPENVVAIADTADGDFICLDYKYSQQNPTVVFFEMNNAYGLNDIFSDNSQNTEELEEYFIFDSTSEKNYTDFDNKEEAIEFALREKLEFVADSFADFLDMLYVSEED